MWQHQIRVVEVLAALSLTTDLASGVPFEKGLRTCAVATAFARSLGLDEADAGVVFHAALPRADGCTAHASENADLFGDDMAFEAALKELDPGDPAMFAAQMRQFGSWAGPAVQEHLAARFLELAPVAGPQANRAACEVGRALGSRLGIPASAVTALEEVYERWDGLGIPAVKPGKRRRWRPGSSMSPSRRSSPTSAACPTGKSLPSWS